MDVYWNWAWIVAAILSGLFIATWLARRIYGAAYDAGRAAGAEEALEEVNKAFISMQVQMRQQAIKGIEYLEEEVKAPDYLQGDPRP